MTNSENSTGDKKRSRLARLWTTIFKRKPDYSPLIASLCIEINELAGAIRKSNEELREMTERIEAGVASFQIDAESVVNKTSELSTVLSNYFREQVMIMQKARDREEKLKKATFYDTIF